MIPPSPISALMSAIVSPPGVSAPHQLMMLTPPIRILERIWNTVQATPRNTVACETMSFHVAG